VWAVDHAGWLDNEYELRAGVAVDAVVDLGRPFPR
jgi:hypothetical protein